jgi:quinone-modifying oxidoreductase, subunit QmoC
MSEWRGWDKIKYQAQLDPGFAEEIASIPGGDKLYSCIQCGTCSGMCPLSTYMDYAPRRIIAMIREGFKGEVLTSYTSWLCASCYACTVECPKEIKITDIMYAVKRRAIKEGVYPRGFPIPTLARDFFSSVVKTGRVDDGRLGAKLYFKTNPLKILGMMGMGMKLFFKGRIGLTSESIKGKNELRTILNAVPSDRIASGRRSASHAGKEHS